MQEVEWQVEPASAATEGADHIDPANATFTLEREGAAVFTGCLVPADDGPRVLCDQLAIRIDDGQPILELSSPRPGQELDDVEGIRVAGSVADRSMVRVYANGEVAEIDDLGMFELTVPARFGVNHLVVSASDGLTDASEIEMDVVWAHGFSPAMGEDGTPEITFEDGLQLWLGQPFFDDGEALDPAATPLITRDLADLLEVVIGNIDVSNVLENPVVDMAPTFTMEVHDPVLAEPHAELDLTAEGADLFLRLGHISAETRGGLMVEGTSLPLQGNVTGSAVAFARIVVQKDSEDDELVVSLEDLAVGIETIEGTFVSAETDAVFDLLTSAFRTTLEDVLLDLIRGTMEESVPAVLGDALGAVDSALMGQEIPLASAPFPAVTIQIDGAINRLSTTFRGEMEARLRTTVGTDVPSIHADSRGVARLDLLPNPPRFYREGSLQLGVRLAMLNGLLYSLWSSGLLEVDATPLLPAGISGLVQGATLSGRIAPILRPPLPTETDDLILTVGQLELDLTYMGQPVRYAVSLEAGVNIDLSNNHIQIDLAEEPVIRVWTLVPPRDPGLLTSDTVADLLLGLWPDLAASVAGGLAFDLPLPALGDLGGLAPGLGGFALELDQTERVRTRRGVLVLQAEMTGSL